MVKHEMETFITIDRLRRLQAGQILDRWSPRGEDDLAGLTEHDVFETSVCISEMFPEGITAHGQRYFAAGIPTCTASELPEMFLQSSWMVEAIAELLRRSEFPEKASRFECCFAWRERATAERFLQAFPSEHQLVTVRGRLSGVYDMQQLRIGNTVAATLMNLRRYWAGEPSTDPLWETLLLPPVEVVDIITR